MSRWKQLIVHTSILIFGLLLAYGLMFIDARYQIWPTLGLDYSTHTAVALVMIIFLCIAVRKYALVWAGSLMCYFLLMLYQEYHSIADIITTGLVVCLFYIPVACLLNRITGAIRT
jgi:hypothetical protein